MEEGIVTAACAEAVTNAAGHTHQPPSLLVKRVQCEKASWLLGELTQAQIKPDTVTFCAAIPSCELESWKGEEMLLG